MSSFKKTPKQKNLYPQTLHSFERKRTRDWVIKKVGTQSGVAAGKIAQNLQRFSGKRGK